MTAPPRRPVVARRGNIFFGQVRGPTFTLVLVVVEGDQFDHSHPGWSLLDCNKSYRIEPIVDFPRPTSDFPESRSVLQ
jgi:hypothetical protein